MDSPREDGRCGYIGRGSVGRCQYKHDHEGDHRFYMGYEPTPSPTVEVEALREANYELRIAVQGAASFLYLNCNCGANNSDPVHDTKCPENRQHQHLRAVLSRTALTQHTEPTVNELATTSNLPVGATEPAEERREAGQ